MKLKTMRINATTDASGAATVYGDAVVGLLYAVQTVDGTFDDGVDLTLTCESEYSHPLLTKADFNSDALFYPRDLVHAVADGAALTGTSGGDRAMPVLNGRPKVVVAQGGNAKTGAVILFYFEEL